MFIIHKLASQYHDTVYEPVPFEPLILNIQTHQRWLALLGLTARPQAPEACRRLRSESDLCQPLSPSPPPRHILRRSRAEGGRAVPGEVQHALRWQVEQRRRRVVLAPAETDCSTGIVVAVVVSVLSTVLPRFWKKKHHQGVATGFMPVGQTVSCVLSESARLCGLFHPSHHRACGRTVPSKASWFGPGTTTAHEGRRSKPFGYHKEDEETTQNHHATLRLH